jgi:hypothetical protein
MATVLLIHGEPVAVIAPYGHERRPGAAARIRFDQTAPPEASLVLTDVWGGSIRTRQGRRYYLAHLNAHRVIYSQHPPPAEPPAGC